MCRRGVKMTNAMKHYKIHNTITMRPMFSKTTMVGIKKKKLKLEIGAASNIRY